MGTGASGVAGSSSNVLSASLAGINVIFVTSRWMNWKGSYQKQRRSSYLGPPLGKRDPQGSGYPDLLRSMNSQDTELQSQGEKKGEKETELTFYWQGHFPPNLQHHDIWFGGRHNQALGFWDWRLREDNEGTYGQRAGQWETCLDRITSVNKRNLHQKRCYREGSQFSTYSL